MSCGCVVTCLSILTLRARGIGGIRCTHRSLLHLYFQLRNHSHTPRCHPMSAARRLQLTYRHADSRRTQETLRRHVLRVLRVWRERFIFPDDFLNGLQAAFLRPALADLSLEAGGGGDGAGAVKMEEGGGDSSMGGQHVKAPPGKEALLAALEALPEEELLRKARSNGLSNKGGRPAVLQRLLLLDEYLSAEGGSGLMHSLGLQLGAASGAAADGGVVTAAGNGTARAGSGSGIKREAGPWGDPESSDEDDQQQQGGGLFGSVVLPGADVKGEPGVGGSSVAARSPHMGRMTIKMEADVAGGWVCC